MRDIIYKGQKTYISLFLKFLISLYHGYSYPVLCTFLSPTHGLRRETTNRDLYFLYNISINWILYKSKWLETDTVKHGMVTEKYIKLSKPLPLEELWENF